MYLYFLPSLKWHRFPISIQAALVSKRNIFIDARVFVRASVALTVPSFDSSHQNRPLRQATVCSESRLGDKELNITITEPLHMLLQTPAPLSLIQPGSFQRRCFIILTHLESCYMSSCAEAGRVKGLSGKCAHVLSRLLWLRWEVWCPSHICTVNMTLKPAAVA